MAPAITRPFTARRSNRLFPNNPLAFLIEPRFWRLGYRNRRSSKTVRDLPIKRGPAAHLVDKRMNVLPVCTHAGGKRQSGSRVGTFRVKIEIAIRIDVVE